MKKYIIYRIDNTNQTGQYYIKDINEIFNLMGCNRGNLPKLKIRGSEVNQPEITELMKDNELLRLISNADEWVITNL